MQLAMSRYLSAAGYAVGGAIGRPNRQPAQPLVALRGRSLVESHEMLQRDTAWRPLIGIIG